MPEPCEKKTKFNINITFEKINKIRNDLLNYLKT